MRYQEMRILCMFDLPMETKKQQRQYRYFRKNLLQNGFSMLQYSVYYRIVPNRSAGNKFETLIRKSLPSSGNVRLLYVSEKQFDDMKLLVGQKTIQEQTVGSEKMVII